MRGILGLFERPSSGAPAISSELAGLPSSQQLELNPNSQPLLHFCFKAVLGQEEAQ